MKLSEIKASDAHRVLLFGPPKSGKTELAGKVTTDFDVILVDMEKGSNTLRKLPLAQQARIELISLPDTRSFPIAIETCLKLVKGGPIDLCVLHGKVSCSICKKAEAAFGHYHFNELPLSTIVIWDSLTQLTNSTIAHITKGQDELYKLQTDDWGNLGKLLDTFLSHIQQAPYNTICISHETEVEMEGGKQKLVPTAGTRNFSRNTAKYFDEVVYCEVKNKEHIAASSTTYSNKILTGSRTGFRLEDKAGKASLVPIFKGELPAPHSGAIAASGTPAANSLSALEKLKLRLKNG